MSQTSPANEGHQEAQALVRNHYYLLFQSPVPLNLKLIYINKN